MKPKSSLLICLTILMLAVIYGQFTRNSRGSRYEDRVPHSQHEQLAQPRETSFGIPHDKAGAVGREPEGEVPPPFVESIPILTVLQRQSERRHEERLARIQARAYVEAARESREDRVLRVELVRDPFELEPPRRFRVQHEFPQY